MLKKMSCFLLLGFILVLTGCSDEWNDLVDTISGSGDDNPAPAQEEVAAVASSEASEAPSHQQNPGSTATLSTAPKEAATEEKAPEEAAEEVAAATVETKEAPPEPEVTRYESRFHHTTTASSDGGKSLVLCPGQRIGFDRCESNGVDIPRHSDDHNRETYWNMFEEPRGDIVCVKDGKSYRYKANAPVLFGDC